MYPIQDTGPDNRKVLPPLTAFDDSGKIRAGEARQFRLQSADTQVKNGGPDATARSSRAMLKMRKIDTAAPGRASNSGWDPD